MTLSASEIAQKNLEMSHHEVIDLRNELSRKHIELETAQKTVTIYREKLRGMTEGMVTLKDDLDHKGRHNLRNQKYLARLSSTNKMLIGSLHALDVTPPSPVTRSADRKHRSIMLKPMSINDAGLGDGPGADGAGQLISRPTSPTTPGGGLPPQNDTTATTNAPLLSGGGGGKALPKESNAVYANEKLRASLLRVAREHYLSQKMSEGLERKIDVLKQNLRNVESKNKQLINELNEMRSVHSEESAPHKTVPGVSSAAAAAAAAASSPAAAPVVGGASQPSAARIRFFGKIDDRFKACLKRESISAEVGLMTTRRILEFMSHAPASMGLAEAAAFLVSREACKIFDVEFIGLFRKRAVLPGPGGRVSQEFEVERWNMRADKPETFALGPRAKGAARCLAYDTITQGHPLRNNNPRVGSYDPDVDAGPGVGAFILFSFFHPRPFFHYFLCTLLTLPCSPSPPPCPLSYIVVSRFMIIPIRDQSSDDGSIMGSLLLLNKQTEGFSEADELMAIVFADQVSTLLTQCIALERSRRCLRTYRRVLESAVEAYRVIPDADALTAKQEFGVTTQAILVMLEELCRDCLRCTRSRAFLVTDSVVALSGRQDDVRLPADTLLMLNHTASGRDRSEVIAVSTTLGVAGHVVSSRSCYDIADSASDDRLNPQIDLEVVGKPVLSVPVLAANGRALAVIQLSPGPDSPKSSLPLVDAGDNPLDQLLFAQAAQWMAYQLAHPLTYLFQLVGRQAVQPAAVPFPFAERRVSTFKQANDMLLRSVLASAPSSSSASSSVEDTSSTERQKLQEDAKEAALLAANASAQLAAREVELEALRAAAAAAADSSAQAQALVEAANAAATERVEAADARTAELEAQLSKQAQRVAELEHRAVKAEALAEAAMAMAADEPAPAPEPLEASQAAAAPKDEADAETEALRGELAALKADLISAAAQLESKSQELAALLVEVEAANDAVAKQRAERVAEVDTLNSELLSAMTAATKARADLEVAVSDKESTVAMMALLEEQLFSARGDSEQKDAVIAILQEQLVKMAEEQLKGTDLTALRESLATSLAQVQQAAPRPSTGTGKPPSSRAPASAAAPPTRPTTAANEGNDAPTSVAYPWTELFDDAGNRYYFNQLTQESQWEAPSPEAAALAEASVAESMASNVTHGDWVEAWTEEGQLYYIHQVTGESAWELPVDPESTATA
jgi:hypothetical protein